MQKVIYLDHNATTPVDEHVLKSMIPYFNSLFGNPSGNSHSQSWITAGAVKRARKQVADLINADPSEIIFTSGASESINLAIKGVLKKAINATFVTSDVEHAAGLSMTEWAMTNGHEVDCLKVGPNGLLDLDLLESTLFQIQNSKTNSTPILVSLILAHNEIGSLYNLKDLTRLKSSYDFILHLDATQALLTEPVDMSHLPVDLMSFSAHKLYGPKGVGALYINKKTVGHQLEPLILGGGQEFGLRSGTLNVPGIVGFGEACELCLKRRDTDLKHYKHLTHFFKTKLLEHNLIVKFNGDSESRIFQNISLTLPESFQSVDLLSTLNGFCISQGSACGSDKTSLNPTLTAIGLSETQMRNTLRIGLGRGTTEEELELFVLRLTNVV